MRSDRFSRSEPQVSSCIGTFNSRYSIAFFYCHFNQSSVFYSVECFGLIQLCKTKNKGRPFYSYCSYVKGSALAVVIRSLLSTSGVLPFPDFAEASEEVLYHQRSFPLQLIEPAQVLPVCLSRTQLPFFQRSVCGHRRCERGADYRQLSQPGFIA